MPRDTTSDLRARIDALTYSDGAAVARDLARESGLTEEDRRAISERGAALVREIRSSGDPGLMEVFLSEYGLSTEEGIALMCLAEALLRVPDAETIDALIEDKIAPSDWGQHLGHSASPLVNASTWALMLTGRVLDDDRPGPAKTLRGAMKRLGEPVIRTAVGRAMREMGRQFVLGEDIKKAMSRGAKQEARGYTYSYDMLGEAARTESDAQFYHDSYAQAIAAISKACTKGPVAQNPGISVKLSALLARYEVSQADRVMDELVPRLRDLCRRAAKAGMGLNIDAEESDRLSLSLDVIETVLADPKLANWTGFGVVVQAYGQRAAPVLDWLHETAERLDRKIMVRLVKGAYWDGEVKRAQVAGVDGFPVFTSKSASDVSFIACARKLLNMTDRIYPQFATHNAHTVAAVLHMAEGEAVPKTDYEFQRLHGMGETLHEMVMEQQGTRCRIYAPVGAHADLLAYLVRRLLENGANSSFVNQIVDENVPPETVAADPFAALDKGPKLPTGPELFAPERRNSRGWDLTHEPTLREVDAARDPFATTMWEAAPLLAADEAPADAPREQKNPARPGEVVGTVAEPNKETVAKAFEGAKPWDAPVEQRAEVLNKVADRYEASYGELFAIVHREAGKSMLDAAAEVREAVDFLRYYAAQAQKAPGTPRGTWVCISPWNFPLAIFTGQIAAALATGNAVLSKPAEQTPLIAHRAAQLMHEAGVPREVLQLLPGAGETGAALTSDPRVAGVAFTGSTDTAGKIRAAMAENCAPGTPLIAETGGLNAMIVDSTALPEHAVRDILISAFQSAGQRCSALRCLYVQKDVSEKVLEMLTGAMDELRMGDPWQLSTDVGPVIDAEAHDDIASYVEAARKDGRLLHELRAPKQGHFIAPALIRVGSIKEMEREVFGPVLHVATFEAEDIGKVVEDINSMGYGLTFGLHTRIDDRVQEIVDQVEAGNLYVNRNQVGAIVGSQPFGGEGLSGTGPKAGGPNYLPRFRAPEMPAVSAGNWEKTADARALAKALKEAAPGTPPEPLDLPGPTGESNRLGFAAREPLLCMGPGAEAAKAQAEAVRALGGRAVEAGGTADPESLLTLEPLAGVIWWGDEETAKRLDDALSRREGPILPLVTAMPDIGHVLHERHVCIDTTAAGGNAALLAEVSGGAAAPG